MRRVLVLAAIVAGTLPATSAAAQSYLALAEQGVAKAQSAWRDDRQALFIQRHNRPIEWYDERLADHDRYPLATIWGALPLWESLVAVTTADRTKANVDALARVAQGPPPARFAQGAEAYWDAQNRPVPGYAPYPGDRGKPNTWCDDNAWWGLGFIDTYNVLTRARYLADAQRAFSFLAAACWDPVGGGLWWNTAHTPGGQKSGEPLAAGSLLGALLVKAYHATGNDALAKADLQIVEQFLSWADAHFADANGLYWRTGQDPTPTPYIAGTAVEAKELLCQLVGAPYCAQAAALADAAYLRFADRLNMGPQFDVNYLHWMLVYGSQTGDGRWLALAREMASDALANSLDPGSGLYLKAWDGSSMTLHQAVPNMLRTDAATVELFGWLAAVGQ